MKKLLGRGLFAVGLGICFLVGVTARGQERPRRIEEFDEPIRLRSTLVQVPVIVSDSGGKYIADLRREEFTIFEDGVRREVDFFGTVEEPFNVALLIDSSGSTVTQLETMKDAVRAFIGLMRPQDRILLMSFNDSVEIVSELTGDREALLAGVDRIKAGEYTQVYEAVYTAVWERLRDVEGRKAVIIFTDGIDTASSEIKAADTLDAVLETEDVIVYPIRYSTRPDVERRIEERYRRQQAAGTLAPTQLSLEESLASLDHAYRRADEYLHELADASGGRIERADDVGELKAALGQLAEELRTQYLLGYYPDQADRRNRNHKITVQVSRPGLRVRARPAYRD